MQIIEPDGNNIKKEQILNLRNLFAKDSQYTKESIYIINNAERMNKESANTMLKFLEEPSGNVIGFFITNNKENILLTIKSRCQLLEVNFENELCENYGLDEEEYNNCFDITLDYLKKIENKNNHLILHNIEFFENYDKEKIKIIFKIILSIYKNELDTRYGMPSKYKIEFLKHLTKENLKEKLKLIIEFLKEINYNINLNLLLDKFVIEMDGVNDETL